MIMSWGRQRGESTPDEIAPMPGVIFPNREPPPPPLRRIAHPPPIPAESFWAQYVASLEGENWNPIAIRRMEEKVDEMLEHTDLEKDGRLKRTSIMGEVQSGKTASMIGLAAKGLDSGFKIIIVLAGHQNDLRNQTAKRFNKDLLLVSEKVGNEDAYWTIDRTPAGVHGVPVGLIDREPYAWTFLGQQRAFSLPSHADINKCSAFAQSSLERVKDGASAVLVIKKHNGAMQTCMNLITNILGAEFERYPIMIIDDESDYATCPAPHRFFQRPWPAMVRHNWNLITGYGYQPGCMAPGPENPIPGHFNVYAFEYSATPQLPHRQPQNIGGTGKNPFWNHKHIVLPSALDRDTLVEYDSKLPRYGRFSWYTGPEMFYGQDWNQKPPIEEDQTINHPTPNLLDDHIYNPPEGVVFPYADAHFNPAISQRFENGLISYFASGAIRFAQQDAEKGGSCDNLVLSLDSDSHAWPEPHSALIHLDHLRAEHWNQAREIMQLFGDNQQLDTGEDHYLVGSQGFISWLNSREGDFRSWFEYFQIKYQQVVDDGADRPPYPHWDHVWIALNEWAYHVKIKVLNSDRDLPRIPLDFEPRSDGNGNLVAPRDIYTIVIGGNSLSRGITIDGLCTTIFGRVSNNPNQATMMQHQRWCGYRAHYWEFVTLHIDQHALNLMSSWSAADKLARQSNALGTLVPLRLTLINLNGRPIIGAGKLQRPIAINLWGDYQFGHVELIDGKNNEMVMADFIERVLQNPQKLGPHVVNVRNTMSAIDVAEMLDKMEYSTTGTNWAATDSSGGRAGEILNEALTNLFSNIIEENIKLVKSDAKGLGSDLAFSNNPNLVAGYLRLWHYLYYHGELVRTWLSEHDLLNAMGDIDQIQEPPEFNLVFQGGDQRSPLTGESMHPIFRDQRLTDIIPNTIRKSQYRSYGHVVEQMRTGNQANLPGGNRYVDLRVLHGENGHPQAEWGVGLFSNYRYDRGVGEPGVIIGQAFERDKLYDETNTYGAPPVPPSQRDLEHIPVTFMIDIPAGGPSLTFN